MIKLSQDVIRSRGLCGDVSPDQQRICIVDAAVAHNHDWAFASMRGLLQEWVDMPAEPSAGDGLCMTEDVAAEHKEWANRYSDLVMRTTTILRGPL
jgi:hypothetical protein